MNIFIGTPKELTILRIENGAGIKSEEKASELLNELSENIINKRKKLDFLEKELEAAMDIINQCNTCPARPTRADCCSTCLADEKIGRLIEMLSLIQDQKYSSLS